MNTLIKFTFWNGFVLFIAALLLEIIIIYFVRRLGDRQHKKDYENDYNYLKFLVEESDVNDKSKSVIKDMFDEISKYSCKNYEKLQVLEETFIKKFSTKRTNC